MIVHTADALGFGFRFSKSGQQHSGEDRDDSDHNEQLDESESASG